MDDGSEDAAGWEAWRRTVRAVQTGVIRCADVDMQGCSMLLTTCRRVSSGKELTSAAIREGKTGRRIIWIER